MRPRDFPHEIQIDDVMDYHGFFKGLGAHYDCKELRKTHTCCQI
jgi:hypothetical protein